MRILNVMSRYNVGGTAQWLYQLSTGLQKNSIDNLLIIGDCPDGELEDLRIQEQNFVRLSGLGPRAKKSKTFWAFIRLRQEIKNFKPDIVNTHTSKAGVLGRLAALTTNPRPKIVHTYHGTVLSGYFSKPIELAIRTIERILGYFTDYFFVSGEQVLHDLRQAKIIQKENVFKVWPSVPDIEVNDRLITRNKYGISTDVLVVGWLGRKVQIKRIDRILEVARQMPEVTFVIAGDGKISDLEYLEKESLMLPNNVMELGFTSPSEMWSLCDICLITSDNEAIPISPIEAALARVPLVAVDAGSTREVLIDGNTGFLCDKNTTQISLALQKLIDNEMLRREMGEQARIFALSRFEPEQALKVQMEAYGVVLRENS